MNSQLEMIISIKIIDKFIKNNNKFIKNNNKFIKNNNKNNSIYNIIIYYILYII